MTHSGFVFLSFKVFKKYKKSLGKVESEDESELYAEFQKKLFKKLKKLASSVRLLSAETSENVDASSLLEQLKSSKKNADSFETSSFVVQLASEQ